MPKPAPTEADERLARLGREWFAEVRNRNPVEEAPRRKDRSGTDADGSLSEWLFGSSDGDGGDCGGGDGD